MPKPNGSHEITEGSGEVLAAHGIGSILYPVVVPTDALGEMLFDPSDCFAGNYIGFIPDALPVGFASILNADATLLVDVLAVWLSGSTENSADDLPASVIRITAHSSGALLTPVKLDTNTANLDADITVRGRGTGGSLLSITTSGSALAGNMVRGPMATAGQFNPNPTGRFWLWNHLQQGPIVCRQNEGVAISNRGDGSLLGPYDMGFIFRVR